MALRFLSALIGALVLCNPALLSAAPLGDTKLQQVQPERSNWRVRTAWVKELEPSEQVVVLLLIRSALNQKLFELIEHNGTRRDKNLRWILGTQAWGNHLLAQLATKDANLRGIFNDVSERLLPIYLGTKPVGSYVDFSNEVTQKLASRFSKLDMKRAESIAANYQSSIDAASTATIVTAMTASSSAIDRPPKE